MLCSLCHAFNNLHFLTYVNNSSCSHSLQNTSIFCITDYVLCLLHLQLSNSRVMRHNLCTVIRIKLNVCLAYLRLSLVNQQQLMTASWGVVRIGAPLVRLGRRPPGLSVPLPPLSSPAP